MIKSDQHLVEEWATQYPVGTKVEVKYRGWAVGVVTGHHWRYGTVSLKVKTEQFGILFYLYGNRKEVRTVK